MTLSLTAWSSDSAEPKTTKVKSPRFDVWTMDLLWFGLRCRSDGLAEGRAESQSEIERLTRELETYKARLEALSNQGS